MFGHASRAVHAASQRRHVTVLMLDDSLTNISLNLESKFVDDSLSAALPKLLAMQFAENMSLESHKRMTLTWYIGVPYLPRAHRACHLSNSLIYKGPTTSSPNLHRQVRMLPAAFCYASASLHAQTWEPSKKSLLSGNKTSRATPDWLLSVEVTLQIVLIRCKPEEKWKRCLMATVSLLASMRSCTAGRSTEARIIPARTL